MNLRVGLWALFCILSGIVGAVSTNLLSNESQMTTARVKRLELVDSRNIVRAVLSTGPDNGVYLRFLSEDSKPTVELRTTKTGEGKLTFSGDRIPDQVIVGYSPYGDYEDGNKRGAWGKRISGPDHSQTGINVFTLNGVLQGTQIPLEPPLVHR